MVEQTIGSYDRIANAKLAYSVLYALKWRYIGTVFQVGLQFIVCLLRPELQFQSLALIETTSYFVGFGIVGISLALSGHGVWSLVAANIVQAFCLVVFAVYFTRPNIWPYFHAQEYRDLIRVA